MSQEARVADLIDDLRQEYGRLTDLIEAQEVTLDERKEAIEQLKGEKQELADSLHAKDATIEALSVEAGGLKLEGKKTESLVGAVQDLVEFLQAQPPNTPSPALWQRDRDEYIRKVLAARA